MNDQPTLIDGEIVDPGTNNKSKGHSANKPNKQSITVAKKTVTKKAPDVGTKALKLWDQYLGKSLVQDFSQVPTYSKLTMLQYVPLNFIKSRNVGGSQVPYIEHEFAEKALNFAFNFNVDVEVESAESFDGEYERSAKDQNGNWTKKKTKFTEVNMRVKFTFFDPDTNRKIVRTVFSGHRGYESQATTKSDVYKSALSKAYTVVARTFGIASNIKDATAKDAKEIWRNAQNQQKATTNHYKQPLRVSEVEREAYEEAENAQQNEVGQIQPKSWED